MTVLPPAPRPLDSAMARRLREAFAAAGFTRQVFTGLGLLGSQGWRASVRDKASRLSPPECGTLVKFCVARDALAPEEVARAVGGADVLAALETSGVAARHQDGTVQCLFQVTWATDVLVLTDAIDDPASMSPPDGYIIPVAGASRAVDDLTVREPCELAVDMACGQGYHAVRSMSHARRGIATDISPRAIAFARVNAELNGVSDRIEVREGSFFQPLADVAGRIDLLTCNPPFVMQPGAHITSAVSPSEGDGMVEELVRGLPRMLREGGWATMSALWENADPRDWHARVRGWLQGAGCDAIIMQFQTYLPSEYLTSWFPPDVRAGIEAGWKVLCERRKIGALTYGAIIMHKRAAPNWISTLSSPIFARSGSASAQVKALFDSQTAMQFMWGPMDLLDRKLRVAAGWRFDPAQGQPRRAPEGVRPGLALPLTNAARWEPLLAAFDGSTTARETLTKLRGQGMFNLSVDHPETGAMIQGLVAAGCLDILA